MLSALLPILSSETDTVIALQRLLVSHPALSPDNGGVGETDKAKALMSLLAGFGFPAPRMMPAPDPRVPSGERPNFAYIIPGTNTKQTLWVLAHLDVVPPGDLAMWNQDPFTLKVDGDTLTGRGVEDNHQAVVTSVLVGKALCQQRITPPINYGILFLADEETGNQYGMHHVLKHHADLFGPDDLFLVPDCGRADGLFVEVAEKSVLWLKVTVTGRQCHASMPELGINSLRAAAAFITRVDELYAQFDRKDPTFVPPISTFEPTKKDANVDSVNIIPGRDSFCIDCRVLPGYDLRDVLTAVEKIGHDIAARFGVTIAYEQLQYVQAAPATPIDAPVVRRLCDAIRAVRQGEPVVQGIGGGTFAAPLRMQGHHAAAWATIKEMAHQPNESASIQACLSDAEIVARVLFGA